VGPLNVDLTAKAATALCGVMAGQAVLTPKKAVEPYGFKNISPLAEWVTWGTMGQRHAHFYSHYSRSLPVLSKHKLEHCRGIQTPPFPSL
jgi:hypothetical protein